MEDFYKKIATEYAGKAGQIYMAENAAMNTKADATTPPRRNNRWLNKRVLWAGGGAVAALLLVFTTLSLAGRLGYIQSTDMAMEMAPAPTASVPQLFGVQGGGVDGMTGGMAVATEAEAEDVPSESDGIFNYALASPAPQANYATEWATEPDAESDMPHFDQWMLRTAGNHTPGHIPIGITPPQGWEVISATEIDDIATFTLTTPTGETVSVTAGNITTPATMPHPPTDIYVNDIPAQLITVDHHSQLFFRYRGLPYWLQTHASHQYLIDLVTYWELWFR